MRKTRLLLLWAFLLGAIQLNAQYTFTATFHAKGSRECSTASGIGNSILAKINSQISYPTRAQCEQERAAAASFRYRDGFCEYYFTTTPCTGTDLNSFGSNSTSKISGMPSQNAGVAIRNEMQDYAYQQSIQNGINAANSVIVPGTPDYNASVNKIIANDISSGNNAQVVLKRMIPNLNDRIAETARLLLDLYKQGYGSSSLISQMFSEKFKELTGFNVYAINNKTNQTLEDREVINSYNEYVDMVCKSIQEKLSAEEERVPELEMAAYSLIAYKDEGSDLVSDYFKPNPLRDMSVIRNPQERNGAEKIVNFITDNEGRDGFNSEIYYDKDRGEYVIAIRGTEFEKSEDRSADMKFAQDGESPQHDIAYKLAQAIKDSGIPLDKIKITGHSLGGGLATLVGMITGCETYVYNPQHISVAAAKHYKLDLSRQDNIHTYTAPTEAVTIAEGAYNVVSRFSIKNQAAGPINTIVAVKDAINCGLPKEQLGRVIVATNSNTAYLNLGSQETVEGADIHRIGSMYSAIASKDSSKKWLENRDAFKYISNIRSSGELQLKALSINKPASTSVLQIKVASKK